MAVRIPVINFLTSLFKPQPRRNDQSPEMAKVSVSPKSSQSVRVASMEYLVEQDRGEVSETPPGFAYHEEMAAVRALGNDLSRICGHELSLDDQVQDASYFAAWCAIEPMPRENGIYYGIISIKFSSFGRMYYLGCDSEKFPITPETCEAIVDFLHARGYVLVPETLADLPYPNSTYVTTWYTRFFDYL